MKELDAELRDKVRFKRISNTHAIFYALCTLHLLIKIVLIYILGSVRYTVN